MDDGGMAGGSGVGGMPANDLWGVVGNCGGRLGGFRGLRILGGRKRGRAHRASNRRVLNPLCSNEAERAISDVPRREGPIPDQGTMP